MIWKRDITRWAVLFAFLAAAAGCETGGGGAGETAGRTGTVASGKSVAVGKAVVVSADSIASRVGVEILERGGNAVDAAVAVGFALAVTYPRAGNIGGGGFMLVRLASGESRFIDYREAAPSRATRYKYLDESGNVVERRSTRGHLAAGVPGTVAGLSLAHRSFGSLPWADVVAPAWRLASNGFPVDSSFVRAIAEERELLESHPVTQSLFLEPGLRPGHRFRQPELASTLYRLMTIGEKDFYSGRTAAMILEEMKRGGGLIDKLDLDAYRAKFRDPVRVSYRGFEILSAPLPSSGGIILSELFQLLARWEMGDIEYHSRDHVHLLAEAEKIAYRLRALYMGDPDFYPAPSDGLVQPAYIDRLHRLIDPSRALPVQELDAIDLSPAPAESRETTHFSIVDRWGNAVSNTYTLNGSFGSGVTVTGGGFLLNNEMDDFSLKPGHPNLYGLVGSEANAIEPGKRMLSSMSPTIVSKDGKLFMIAGTPGGSTIPTTVLQVISNVIDYGMTLEEAVAAARVHHQYLPDRISIEAGALTPEAVEALRGLGHEVVERDPIGDVQAILIRDGRLFGRGDRKGGRVVGVSDPRGNGRALGY